MDSILPALPVPLTNTLTDANAIRYEVAQANHHWYAINRAWRRPGAFVVRGAIVNSRGQPVEGFYISFPDIRFTEDDRLERGRMVAAAASEIVAIFINVHFAQSEFLPQISTLADQATTRRIRQ